MRMHKNILGGGHLLGNNSPVARRHRCAGAERPLPARGFRRAFRLATASRLLATTASFALILLAGALLFPTTPDSAHAETPTTPTEASPRATTSVSLNVPATIEFADVMATPSGVTTTASAEIEVTTTASAGYKLYVYAEDNSLKSLNPQTQQTIAATAQTSAVEELVNNTWGYNLSEGTTAGTTFAELPTSDATPAAEKDTSATGGATGDAYTLTLGAKVDSTMPSGTYTSTLTISVVADPALVTIVFNGNGATSGSTASQQIAAGNTASLNANGFTRTGYAFTGWNTVADGSGTSYADAASLTTIAAQAGQTITLYAQWGPSIQDFTNAQCQSLASNSNYTVYDERDGSDYTVRYINGACWMTQNLRLSGGRTITPSDSDVDSNWAFPNNSLKTGDTNYIGNSYTEASFVISDDSQHATEYGGYYNYCAASAGSVCAQTEMDATQSICPAGWTLPTGDSNSQQSGITSYVDAFSPVYSGYYYNGSLGSTYGYWWSATAYSSSSQYFLSYRGGSLYTNYYSKNFGFSVRCIRSS